MFAIALLRYRKPLDEVLSFVDEHRDYLRALHLEGVLLASGPMDPRTGGILLLKVDDHDPDAHLDRVRDGDPFWKRGLAQYELLRWMPVIGKDGLDRL
jgi:uncharacterized protein YciI